MPDQNTLAGFLADFLHVAEIDDPWCVNGVQVPGKKQVQKIAVGVSASRNFLQQAADWGADAALVHHGIFWKKGVRSIDPLLGKRLEILYKNDISLFAYHLPLDAHPQIGNNARIAQAFDAESYEMSGISAIAKFAQPRDFDGFVTQCEEIFGQQPVFALKNSTDPVQTVGICSGGGADFVFELADKGIDTFVTGEISEHHFHDFAELGLNVVVCGHYATETFGVRALQAVLQEEFFELELSFFPEACPV